MDLLHRRHRIVMDLITFKALQSSLYFWQVDVKLSQNNCTINPVPFKELQHTGDLQYQATGSSKEEMLEESARALFSTITDLDQIEESKSKKIEVEGDTDEELLINFLRTCLDLFNENEFIAKTVSVSLDGDHLIADLKGEKFDLKKHKFGTEIKAVTYHGALAKEKNGKWEAVFTLDL